jgi:PAS domain S-box-containing protein
VGKDVGKRLLEYGAAVLAVAAAVFVRWLLDPLLGQDLALATLYGAVAVAVWFGGYRPALLAAVLGYVAANYLFVEPRGALGIERSRDVVDLVLYSLSCAILIGFGEAVRFSLRRAEANRQEALARQKQLEQEAAVREQAQEALAWSEQLHAAELEAMTRLHALSARLLASDDLGTALNDVLENAIRTSGADLGNIQLYNPQIGALEIVAQRGFRQDFLDYFRTVRVDEGSACAQAMQSGTRVILEDVERDPAYEPHRHVAAAAGYRAVQSTPLTSRRGSVLGMLSTHFRTPHRPSERDERLLDLYARHAADLIERLRSDEALRESEARKAAVLENALDCIITIDHEGKVIEFNPAAERTFGYRREQAVGRELADLIIPPSLRQRPRSGLPHFLATGEGPVLDKRIEMPAMRSGGTEFPVELAVTRIPTQGPPVFTAYLRDLTQRHMVERRRNARLAVTQVIAESSTLRDAAASILRAICEGLGWDVGLLWVVDPKAETLRCDAVWHRPSVRVESFERVSRERTFKAGIGLPGRIWRSGQPAWIPDVGQDRNFPRAPVARQDGLHGAFGFPILRGTEVLGVMEFFSAEIREPDTDLLEMVTTIGGQLGQLMGRKRAEESVRAATEQLQIVTDCMAAPVTRCSRELEYLWVSKPYADWIGRPPEEIVGRPIVDVVGREAFEQLWPHFELVLAGNTVRYEEAVDFRGLGRRWVNGVYTPTFDSAGVPDGWVAVVLDITERRQMEEALRESEQRFSRFMEHLPGLAWIKDLQGRYVYANDAAVKVFRHPRDRLYGRTDEEVFPPVTAEQFKQNDQSALESESGVQIIETLEHEDGIVHHSLVSKFPILGPEGGSALVGGMAIDITDRLRAEEVLAESEQRFRQLAESINEVFWMADPQTTEVLYVSPAYEEVWGRSCRSLYEQPRSFLDAVHPEDRERVWVAAVEKHGRGEPTDEEYRVIRPDGSVRWVRDRAFPVKDAAGRIYRMAGIAEDVTEKKRAEEALKENDRRKDEFLATLAHELRNPLAPIRTAAQVLRMSDVADPHQRQARDIIDRQVQQMARLIDDLLDISRITRGKLQLRKEGVELAAAVRTAVEAARPLIDAHAHQLTVTLPPEPVRMDADPVRLAQVFANLLNNAAKYTEKGGQIWLSAERQGREVMVSVRDTGIGIPAEYLPRLFEMFSQLAPALERSQGGLGIGLALVRGLVELHGGRVEAHSAGPGRGCEFIVRLPTLDAPVQARQEPSGDGERTRGGPRCRILVADDLRDSVESLAMMLRLAGHDIQAAHDGLAAVQAAATFRPDVVLLDIGMPRMNGYEAARHIRGQPWGKDMALIALTGWGLEEDRRRALEAGFDHHLTKPVDPAALEKLIAMIAPRR